MLLSLIASAGAADIEFDAGWVGPFALSPDGSSLAVIEENGPCMPDARDSSGKLHVYALSNLKTPKSTVDLGAGCNRQINWAGDAVVVLGKEGQLRSFRGGKQIADLGKKKWGSIHVSPDGKLLASVSRKQDGTTWHYTTRLFDTADWKQEGQTNLELVEAKRPPVVVNQGFGLLHRAEGKLWVYDLTEGVLIKSLPEPKDSDVWLELVDRAAPGGEELVYVANDFQSGFDKPFPQMGETKVAKHVLTVPKLELWCPVEGARIDKLRDFTKATLGSGYVPTPGAEPREVYQRSIAWDTLVAFLMPPVDQFRNPFGSGQVALVIKTKGAKCEAKEIAPLDREPFRFDANTKVLVVSTDRHTTDNAFKSLTVHPIPAD